MTRPRLFMAVAAFSLSACAGGPGSGGGPVSEDQRARAVAELDAISRQIEARCAAGSERDCARGEITVLRLQMLAATQDCGRGDPEACRRQAVITREVLEHARAAEACGGWFGPGREACRRAGRVAKAAPSPGPR